MAWQNPKTKWKAGDVPTASDFNRIEDNIQELENTKETLAGAQARMNTHAGSKQTHGISGSYYIAKTSRSDQLPAWNDIQGKPSTYAPAAHTHSPAQISPQGAGSGLNADALRGKNPSDFMSATKLYGMVEYTDSIPAEQTLTKTIALGGNYRHGIAVFQARSAADKVRGIMVFFGTDPIQTKIVGYGMSSSDRLGAAWTRRKQGFITEYGTLGRGVAGGAGAQELSINDVYISGSQLVIVFKNNATSSKSLRVEIDWEVW